MMVPATRSDVLWISVAVYVLMSCIEGIIREIRKR